jgi:anti-anti-sigma factor
MGRLARLRFDVQDQIAIAALDGEIDLSNASDLETAIAQSVPNEALGLVVDVAEVKYLDSAGIGLLFNLARRVSRRQQGFAVVAPTDASVRAVLTLTGAPQVISIHESLDETVSALLGERRNAELH